VQQVEMETASVLVVDDNPLIQNVIKSLLTNEAYDVTCCSNGEEALSALNTNEFDVIVCDVMMPRLDGYGLHQQVRERSDLAHIPFIFLTALGDELEVKRGRETGADDYIVKPFDPRELVSLIRGKIRRSKNLQSKAEEQYDTFRKRIIHTLSHEFRTPLVAINTGTELLLDQQSLDREKAKQLLEAIQRGGQRLEKLVNDFMMMQQVEAGIADRLFESRARKADLNEVVAKVLESTAEDQKSSEIAMTFVQSEQKALVHIYTPHIENIIQRLVDNAIKFSQARKEVEVQLKREGEHWSIQVCDRGIGLSASRIKEAIDPFGQVDRDLLEQQGGGLGLALASRYAHINKGHLSLVGREGGGVVASLLLPCLKE